jgi:peptidoglycan/xylan/chitin deacetylase (PgdA/CDA1 family)
VYFNALLYAFFANRFARVIHDSSNRWLMTCKGCGCTDGGCEGAPTYGHPQMTTCAHLQKSISGPCISGNCLVNSLRLTVMNHCIILNYHALADHHSPQDPIYGVEVAAFRQQLEIIARLGIAVIPLSQLGLPDAAPGPKVVITFDDGHASDVHLAYPLLEELRWKAAFFVPTQKLIDQPHLLRQYQQLAAAGHYVGPHGVTHRYLPDLDAEQQWQELHDSKLCIAELLGVEANYCALPGGKYNKTTLQVAQQLGYKHLLSTQFGFCQPTNPPFLLHRWTIKRNTPLHQFECILRGDSTEIRRATCKSVFKKTIQKLLPNHLIDTLNYRLHP